MYVLAADRTATDYAIAGAVIIVTVIAALLIARLMARLLAQAGMSMGPAKLVARLVGIVIASLGIIYALQILDVQIAPLFGAFGFFSVVIAFAFQNIINNFVASALIATRAPFRAGDQIETGEFRGTVIEVNSRDVVLLTFDGNHVVIPSSDVLGSPIHNYTSDPIRRTTIPILLPYDCDVREAQKAICRVSRTIDGVVELPSPEMQVTGFGDSGITTHLRFWHPSEELSTLWITSEIAIAVVEALAEINIDIPYPHVDLLQRNAPDTPGPS